MTSELAGLIGVVVGAGLTHLSGWFTRKQDRDANRLSRESHISPDAYALRRQLLSWLREWPLDDNDTDGAQLWAQKVSAHFSVAEERATRVTAAAAEISSDRAVAARRAYLLFYEGTDLLNLAAAGEFKVTNKGESSLFIRRGAADFVQEAKGKVVRCVAELEKAIDTELYDAAASLEGAGREAKPRD